MCRMTWLRVGSIDDTIDALDQHVRNAFRKPVEREKFELSRDGRQGSSRLVPSTTPEFAIHRRVDGEASSLHAAPSHPPLCSLTLPPSP
jgi:hypothetical protein